MNAVKTDDDMKASRLGTYTSFTVEYGVKDVPNVRAIPNYRDQIKPYTLRLGFRRFDDAPWELSSVQIAGRYIDPSGTLCGWTNCFISKGDYTWADQIIDAELNALNPKSEPEQPALLPDEMLKHHPVNGCTRGNECALATHWYRVDDSDLRTPDEWSKEYGLTIQDPDGWRGRNAKSWEEPISRQEFLRRMTISTVNFNVVK